MNNKSRYGALLAISMLFFTGSAQALTVALETFDAGANDWNNVARTGLIWNASGGFDGGAYISSTVDLATNTSAFGSALIQFRCSVQTTGTGAPSNCSDGAFQGDWVSQQVTTLSWWLRHDASIALQPYIRIPSGLPQGNNPAASAIIDQLIQPNTWTEVMLQIDPNNPEFDAAFGGAGFETIFSAVSRLQPGVFFEFGEVYSEDGVTFDIDNVQLTAVPIPAAVWLLASGLGMLGFFGRRNRRKAALA